MMLLVLSVLLSVAGPGETPTGRPGLLFINTQFENASPLYWESDANNVVNIYLVYDQERAAPNRANGHWFFELQTAPSAELTLVLHNFDNIWNGRHGSPLIARTACFVSEDAKAWRPISTEKTEDNCLKFAVTAPTGRLYVARLEPYRLSDLEALEREIRGDARVEIATIGKTVDGRELEIIRIGGADAPHRVLLRARAHPWEAGGNWVVHGLIQRLLRDDAEAKRYLETYCVYIMPMANKDGVVRGRTRFNMLGADLNRQWDKPPDPVVNPENHALESWLHAMVVKGQAPQFMIDLHNDESGGLHISRPPGDFPAYLADMQRFDTMLRRYTWFTERTTGANVRNPGDIGEGLLERFGIDACVLELNANWIAGLDAYPSAERWQLFGAQLCETFYHYFEAGAAGK
jgi:hypothetical protein